MKAISAMQEDFSLLGNVIRDIHHLVRNLQWVRIECTRRGGNRVAHELAQFARNISQDLFWMEDVPPITREALYQDADFSNELNVMFPFQKKKKKILFLSKFSFFILYILIINNWLIFCKTLKP